MLLVAKYAYAQASSWYGLCRCSAKFNAGTSALHEDFSSRCEHKRRPYTVQCIMLYCINSLDTQGPLQRTVTVSSASLLNRGMLFAKFALHGDVIRHVPIQSAM